MAERRMFALKIVDSDAFLDMPDSAQNLYFHLAMRADDDGFISNPKKIMRMIRASDDSMKILLAKRFILSFDTGLVVIKHWRLHNYIAKDRYTETIYKEEKAKLFIKANGAYTDHPEPVAIPYTGCIQDDDTGKVSEGKVSEGKVSEGKVSEGEDTLPDAPPTNQQGEQPEKSAPTLQEITDYIIAKQLVINPDDFLTYYENTGWKDRDGNPVKNWKNKLIQWNKREVEKRPGAKPYSTPVRQAQDVARCSCGGDISYGLCKACGKMYDGLGVEL